MKKILFALLLGSCMIGCNKPDVGFFSENGILMKEDTFTVVKGVYTLSGIPRVDGSTRPIKFELKRVVDVATGEAVPDFLVGSHEINMWLSAFNAKTDTTMAIVNEKLVKRVAAPVTVNPYSGQLEFNAATAYVNDGVYRVEVQATNSKNSKLLENFGILKLLSRPWEVPVAFGDYFAGADEKGKESPIRHFNPYEGNDLDMIKENTHPRRKIYKLAASDIVELSLTVKDSRGQVIDPHHIIYMLDPDAGYYNCYDDNSLAMDGEKVEYTDSSKVFHFPTTPYPAFGRKYNDGDNVYLVYYTISMQAYNLTPEFQQLADQAAVKEGVTGGRFTTYRVSFKNGYKINEPGKWHMEVVSPYITKK